MSGQRLMCVWQAVYAKDTSTKGVAQKQLVRQITSSFTTVNFSPQDFDTFFTGPNVDFDRYVEYVRTHLAKSAGMYMAVEDAIESQCWDLSKSLYRLDKYEVRESDARKIWEVFSRLCEPGTVPPNMAQEEANWIGEKMSAQLGQHWNSSNVPHNMCYGELMGVLSEKCFKKASSAAAAKAIEDLHAWLVQEVAMTGWLYKRTRKQANWTSWLRRWFVLVPGKLVYYDNNKLEKKRGEVIVNSFSKIEELPELKTLARHYPSRFKVTNSPYLELELSAADDHERNAWMDALGEIVNAAKAGTTPVQAILKDRLTQKRAGKSLTVDEATSKLNSLRLQKRVNQEEPSMPPKKAPIPQKMPIKIENDAIREQVNRIQEIFRKVDHDKNGAIDRNEFRNFIKGMGLQITDTEIDGIFSNIEVSNDGIITLDEFTKYFMNNVLDESGRSTSMAEAKLQSAFLRADRDGTGTVDFREFAEYLWEKRRSMRMSKVMGTFDQMAHGKGEISFDQFKDFFSKQRSSMTVILEEEDDNSLEGRLKNMYDDADAERIASFLRERWTAFASFRRPGESGEVVMSGGHGMVADVLPGEYNLVDLACFSDLPPITPRHIVVKNIRWVHAPPNGHGKAIFPSDFDGVLPVEIATTEHLRYYGASLADTTQVQVSLMYRHGIQDFTYQNSYLDDYVKTSNGGSGIEMHDFSHLDCPLEDDSGHFIMGRMDGEDIHLTAFKVPTRHTLYLPGGVIHSNDYLKGTWRTMLSDETEIDHVHLVKRKTENRDSDLIHFSFTFQE